MNSRVNARESFRGNLVKLPAKTEFSQDSSE